MICSHHNTDRAYTAGFSLVELVVTVAIVTLVTGIVMVRYSAFNSSVLLRSQAYELALDMRETQVLAVSVRAKGAEFDEEYGLYFDASTPSQYIFFQDDISFGAQNPAQYDVGEGIGDPYVVDTRFQISEICVTSGGTTCGIADLTISFKRPDFDARFYTTAGIANIEFANITLVPVNGSGSRVVTVYSSGQIAVE